MSSAHELSDNSEDDGEERQSEPESQSESHLHSLSSATIMPYPSIPAPSMQYTTSQHGPGSVMAQAPYPYQDPYYRSIFAPYDAQPYPAQPMVNLQLMGVQQAGVPLSSDAVEEPIFVNAKQYRGILRRRQLRAKIEQQKALQPRKPYLHESRHLHALRRARGHGGRFQKKSENQQEETGPRDKSEGNPQP